jgi:twinkle protein
MISNIEQIKQRADIIEVISDHVKLKLKAGNYEGLCPFHSEKTPSFKVNQSKQIYKCFGCGKNGDSIQFLMEHKGLNYIQAIKEIANKYHIEIEEQSRTYEQPQQRLTKLQPDTLKYFESRGITNNTLLRFNITESTEWMPGANAEVKAICFNYIKDDQLINIKFRAKNKDFKLSKNAELIFYNLDSLKDETTAIIVEGEIDCLSMYEAGFYNVVSVPNGAGTGNQQLKYLDNCWQHFEDKERIIICTDNDEPGKHLKDELARRLGKDRCMFITYPDDCKDSNDVLLKHGKGMLQSMIEQAKRWPIEGVITMDDVYHDICDYYTNGYPKGCAAGLGEFDEYIQFSGGLVTIVTGQPGSGKSEFLDNITTALARTHNWKFGVCSFENPVPIHITKIMEKFVGLSFNFRKDPSHRMQQTEFEEAIYLTDLYFSFINVRQVDLTIEGLLLKFKEMVLKMGIKGVVIDPWNYIEHKIPQGYSETQYISEALTLIKEFAIQTDTHVFLIAHPKKLVKDSSGQYPVTTMYDISGSAHFFNKTDNGISVYRNFKDNTVEVHIQKIRNSWQGKIGFATFNFDTFTRKYIQI